MSASLSVNSKRDSAGDRDYSVRAIHSVVPLAGSPPNALLLLDDDLLNYLICIIRNTPSVPPQRTAEEWDNLLTLLRPHGIYPLLAFHLKGWDEEYRPPEKVMEYLSQALISGCVRNLRNGIQVQKITNALEEAGIPGIVLKGHALARTVYKDPAIRHSSDIDILVKPEDIPRCEPVFEVLGYSCPEKSFKTSRYSTNHQIFYPQKKGLVVELHWTTDHIYNLFSPGWLDYAFENRIKISSDDLTCYTLDPVSHLTFLAFHHVFHHYFMRLDWICDIAGLMKSLSYPDEWEKLRSTCVSNHIRIPLEIALTAGSFWSGYEIPGEFSDFSGWEPASPHEEKLWRYDSTRKSSLSSGLLLEVQGMPTAREKVRCYYRFIFPHQEILRKYRKSESRTDIPMAHLRRWLTLKNYKF